MPGSASVSLIVSIIVMLFCQPLGIVSIVFSALAMSAENGGDMITAGRHLKTANMINMIALGLLLLAVIGVHLFFLFTTVLGVAAA